MPGYYNPYNMYPVTYQSPLNYSGIPQPAAQSYASGIKPMEWVEGEVGARAFQMPQGLPANQPIPLWDSTDTNIFLKSWSPMGFPNPLQKLHYTIEPQNQSMLPGESSGATGTSENESSRYATKEDLNEMRMEIRNMFHQQGPQGNQNGSNIQRNDGNRGGNK